MDELLLHWRKKLGDSGQIGATAAAFFLAEQGPWR
jgi:hypothetical protein